MTLPATHGACGGTSPCLAGEEKSKLGKGRSIMYNLQQTIQEYCIPRSRIWKNGRIHA